MALLKMASSEYGYDLKYGEIAAIWRGSCIIRAQFLNRIRDAYKRQPDLPNLLLDDDLNEGSGDQTAKRSFALCDSSGGLAWGFRVWLFRAR